MIGRCSSDGDSLPDWLFLPAKECRETLQRGWWSAISDDPFLGKECPQGVDDSTVG